MKHLGDITGINGKRAPVVDVVIGGSPCQDLSVSGNRAGLGGARSSLFLEQIRIIREMREEDARRGTDDVRPRYMVWENVPGVLSSGKGNDFRRILEETARVADEAAVIPGPADGKWRTSGAVMGNGWSLAWRILDAQFWGVPQRRRRIALVADFGGYAAPEILFVRKGLQRDIEPCGTKGKGAAGRAVQGADATVAGMNGHKSATGSIQYMVECAPTMESKMPPNVLCAGVLNGSSDTAGGIGYEEENAPTLRAANGGNRTPCVYMRQNFGEYRQTQRCKSILASEDITTSDLVLQAGKAVNGDFVRGSGYVRRLTPLECERLQGFPDGWTDIGTWTDAKGRARDSSDSARYRALGNSIALPPWKWVLKRLCAQYERDATMASLFDGIGGFPLLWEQINGRGTCLWASEIDAFCIAVTTRRFE